MRQGLFSNPLVVEFPHTKPTRKDLKQVGKQTKGVPFFKKKKKKYVDYEACFARGKADEKIQKRGMNLIRTEEPNPKNTKLVEK